MASQKEIKQRIVSVRSTRQITSAMKMVAAAKLRKVQDRVIRLRPYANRMQQILGRVTENLGESLEHPLLTERAPERVLIVTITSQRGLCGALNGNIVRKAIELAGTFAGQPQHQKTDFLAIGKKGSDLLRKKGFPLAKASVQCTDTPSFEQAVALAAQLMEAFSTGEYSRIDLVYSQFQNASLHRVTSEQFLPLKMKPSAASTKDQSGIRPDYLFEPDSAIILGELIPQTLKLQIYKALIDSAASEHGARMTAMTQATDNATQLISDLTLQYNKARQAAITNQLLEVVSGAEALNG